MKKAILLILLLPSLAMAQRITTIAGTGVTGDSGYGGMATAAIMTLPEGIAYDSKGNLYLTNHDHSNFSIRKIDLAGIYTKIAGTGAKGYSGDGGPATAATFDDPLGICIDRYDNILIAEKDNAVIRKINAAGIISTVAGSGTGGYSGDGGPATAAKLNGPVSVRTDTAGNIYIADKGNNVIRKVDKTGMITTFAGIGTSGYSGDGGPATAAEMAWPGDVAIDSAGNIYISDYTNNVIRMVDKAGIIHTVAGKHTGIPYDGDGGPATAAHIWGPWGLAFDSSWNLIFADLRNNRIRKIDPNGIITTVAGNGNGSTSSTGYYSGDNGPATAAELYLPSYVAIGKAGSFIFSDESNNVIRKVDTVKIIDPTLFISQKVFGSENNMAILPNPNKGSFTINGTFSAINEERATVSITNVLGQLVHQCNVPSKKGTIAASININADIPPGTYLLEMKTKYERAATHFIIDK